MRLLDGSNSGGGIFDGDGSSVLWQMLAYVVVILVIGAIATVVMKRVMPKISAGSGKEMSLLETLHLGPRKTLHIVSIGRRKFLVGATKDRISAPTEITSAFENALSSQMSPQDTDQADSPNSTEAPAT